MTDVRAATTWDTTLGQLQLLVTRSNYDTWLRETVGLRHEPHCFVVGAPGQFAKDWLNVQLRPLITKTLARVLGHPIEVVFEVLRLHDDDAPPLLAPLADDVAMPEQFRKRALVPPALNPVLTFDEFVVGDENRLAFESAWSIAQGTSQTNPLVIFGASGLGKTHLLNAIGHAAFERGMSVIYAPAERFGNDFVRARDGAFEAFRNRYRNIDLLLIDDLQFFEGKDGFQKEFFHTFNDLYSLGKRIVVTADRAPRNLAGIMDGLRSRLQCGLTADIHSPHYATRLAILRAKAKRHVVPLPDDALQTIAHHACPSVRELEGYLNRVIAYVPLVGGDVTTEVIEKALSPLTPPVPREEMEAASSESIIDAVCRRTATQPADLHGKSRARDVTYARHMAMYLLREDGRRSVADIGRMFGNRDHSTVLGAIARITAEITTRAETSADLTAIRAALTHGADDIAAAAS